MRQTILLTIMFGLQMVKLTRKSVILAAGLEIPTKGNGALVKILTISSTKPNVLIQAKAHVH